MELFKVNILKTEDLYKKMGKHFQTLDKWQQYIMTSHEGFQNLFGRRADKIRKLYNGMIPFRLYQYFKPQNMKAGAPQLAKCVKKGVGKQKNRNF